MAYKTKAEERIHQKLVELLPKVATVGLTSGSWDEAARALVKALAVFDLAIGVDPALAAGPAPGVKAPKPQTARGVHPHGVAERWDAAGKCAVVVACNMHKNASAAAAAIVKQTGARVLNDQGTQPAAAEPEVKGVLLGLEGGEATFTLPDGERLKPWSGNVGIREYSLRRFERLGLGAEFWELEPSADEVVGALTHVLGLESS